MLIDIALGLSVGLVAGLVSGRLAHGEGLIGRVLAATALIAPLAVLGAWAEPAAIGAYLAAAVGVYYWVWSRRTGPISGSQPHSADEESPAVPR